MNKKTFGDFKHIKLGSLLKKIFFGFKRKSNGFKMGLVLDLVRHHHNEVKT